MKSFSQWSFVIVFIHTVVLTGFVMALGDGESDTRSDATAAARKDWPPAVPEDTDVEITESKKLTVTMVGPGIINDNPYDPVWKRAPFTDVPLLPQNVAIPAMNEGTIDAVRVQAMHDGETIAWRLSWKDESPDGNVDVGRFSDAGAVQFPLIKNTQPMMGLGGQVQALYWKALWQKDIDVGFQDVQDLHPNYWYDLYWFAEGEFPYPVPESFQKPESLQWFIAHQAGNPMAVFSRTTPIEEVSASGWGTLTHQDETVTTGKGAWVDDKWAIVFRRPLKTDDADDYQFDSDMPKQASFAIWDGSKDQVGGRKHWTMWVDFQMEREVPDGGSE